MDEYHRNLYHQKKAERDAQGSGFGGAAALRGPKMGSLLLNRHASGLNNPDYLSLPTNWKPDAPPENSDTPRRPGSAVAGPPPSAAQVLSFDAESSRQEDEQFEEERKRAKAAARKDKRDKIKRKIQALKDASESGSGEYLKNYDLLKKMEEQKVQDLMSIMKDSDQNQTPQIPRRRRRSMSSLGQLEGLERPRDNQPPQLPGLPGPPPPLPPKP